MPVILPPEDYETWLDPDLRATERLTALLRPYPRSEMSAYAVSALVNSPSNDSPHCIEPLSGAGDS